MRILDLFCGAGGAAKGYHDAGFEVVGVDIKPQPNYPFGFQLGDAIEWLEKLIVVGAIESYDAIHASPPCQRWSSMSRKPDDHPDLITPLRPLLNGTRLPYVIENVPLAPLNDPIMLCGSSFGLGVRRHRNFESNIELSELPCRHEWQKPRFEVYDHGKWYLSGVVPVFGTGGGKARDRWGEAMGIDWMTDEELAEAIPPAYTHFIGAQLRADIESRSLAA